MLDTPCAGWSRITIREWSDRCSYIDDVPFMLLSAVDEVVRRHTSYAVKFDAEGYEYIIVFDELETHIITSKDVFAYTTIEIDIEDVVKELIKDIRNDLDLWAYWPICNEDEFDERRLDLQVWCDVIEKRLK